MNLAHYHRETILNKVESGNPEGIALDCTSCLIALAFAVEALVNFVGSRKVPDWNEQAKSPVKIKKLSKALGIAIQGDVEPFVAISTLRQIRNGLAHGKPQQRNAKAANLDGLKYAMQAPWDSYLDPATVEALYGQVVALRRLFFDAAGIRMGESFTSAVGSF
ncbi:hypothetical protein [Burkholderia multivorans]|uniref:hypothetical protein n=1 Tax=Burkholderia multivorans TaxID=87883 RepID=UPI002019A5E8|nr:hypothetical protein [Burkholderia multivorans]MCA8143578.1 hypothetical protein [Burkholderia multivorans]MCO1368586.1 hypothetical protein [Burkholderia multivorans]MCO1380477.1 hypothetical protein [Burkholderia multivorans]MDN8032127.1 hypothetical protein [Burkholderia multivorans]UQP21417.1 hypothetical protein L0Y98_18295 [Burkholderia multivorans]